MIYLLSKYLLYSSLPLGGILIIVGICSHLEEIIENLEEPE